MYLFTTVLMYLLKLPRSFSLDLHTHAHPVWCFQQSHTDVGLGSHIQFCLKVSSSFLCLLYLMLGANPVKKKFVTTFKITFQFTILHISNLTVRDMKSQYSCGNKTGPLHFTVSKSTWYCKISWWRQAHR